MGTINSLSNLAILPTILLIFHQKDIFSYYIGYFSMIVSVMYHFCESLDVVIILEQLKWHELDNIGAIYSFSQMTLPLTKKNKDLNYKNTKNYIFFFFLLFIQQRGPWELINTILPLILDFSYAFFLMIKYGKPNYNKSTLYQACFFMLISLFFFYKGLDDLNDYLRIWHALWHFFVGITSFYFMQIQEEKFISFKEIFLIYFGLYKNKVDYQTKAKEVMII
jgi:hypothetical protein